MTPTLLFTLAALCPQGEGGSRLVLPKPAAHVQGSEAPAEQVPEIQRFKQDVMELRRSKRLSMVRYGFGNGKVVQLDRLSMLSCDQHDPQQNPARGRR